MCGEEIHMVSHGIESGILKFSLNNADPELYDCVVIIDPGSSLGQLSFFVTGKNSVIIVTL